MDLASALSKLLPPQRILTRPFERLAYAHDASYFSLVPQAVVQPVSMGEVRDLFRFSQQHRIPMTFRSGGTSLCGQAVTNGILIDLSKHWGAYAVEENGALLRAQPGLVGAYLNTVLKPYGRKIGPDPASIDACMLGGILANNSSGMCCGIEENSYRTLHSITFLLPNGFSLNTAEPNAHEIFEHEQPHLARGLLELKRRLLEDPALTARVRRKYQRKNTNGYSLNAFLDYEKPLDILTHLLIGSEGTLAFIAEAVLHTVPDYPLKYTAQLYFPNIQAAAAAVFPLRKAGARAVEIMDRAALRSVENLPGIPEVIKTLPEKSAAILVEFQATDAEHMTLLRQNAERVLNEIHLLHPARFTADPTEQTILWKARKGMFASAGTLRPPGTTLLLEDVVFPVEVLADAVTDLQTLFHAFGYDDAIIFGHAKDGNLHYTIAQSFDSSEERERFAAFNREIAHLVCGKYDGALKGEHGTGRNMAPFLLDEWGENGRALMRDLKSLLDPDGMLNPGVLINDDPRVHITATKSMPITHPIIDQCIECGFCESRCPSRELTLTPRQRIVIQRILTRIEQMQTRGESLSTQTGLDIPDSSLIQVLQAEYAYAGNDTCAVDGLCALACPIGINTGDLTRILRAQSASPLKRRLALFLAAHFTLTENLARLAVYLAHLADRLTFKTWRGILPTLEKLSSLTLPKWNDAMPYPSRWQATQSQPGKAADRFLYFPSCLSRTLGQPLPTGSPSLIETMLTVAARAGITLILPPEIHGTCCGLPFSSKGYPQASQHILHTTLEKLWQWSEHGRLPIVSDTTSCTHAIRSAMPDLSPEDRARYQALTILDSVEFLHDILLPRLKVQRLEEKIVLHPNCSAQKAGLQVKMVAIAQQCATVVEIPPALGCCGFAGDRGLLFPELTASATRREARQVLGGAYTGYYSSNLTCEIGLRQATGKDYLGLVYLVERASR